MNYRQITLTLVAMVAMAPQAVMSLDIEAMWDHRTVAYGWNPPPPGVTEGQIEGTFVADEAIDLIGGDPRFERVSATTFRRAINWDEEVPILAVFRGQVSGDVDSVWALPEPLPVLLPGQHDVPIVHLETDPAGLWSPTTGLYVWGNAEPNWDQRGEDWERPALVTIWRPDGGLEVSQPIGLRINGGWTRCLPQKSLRLYLTRDGNSALVHDFFGDGPTTSSRLLLRQTVWSQFMLKDHWATSLYRDLGHLTSRWTPAVAYLNGEYWGAYSLRERLDADWATITLGHETGAIDVVKDGETIHGDPYAWPEFLNWVDTWPQAENHEFYQQVSTRLDLPAYTDWLLVNATATSAENGFFHNLVLLRAADGQWATAMWDEDNIIFGENIYADYLRFFAATDAAEYAAYQPPLSYFPAYDEARPYCRLLRQLVGNPEYRDLLAQRGQMLLEGPLAPPAMAARMDSVVAVFQSELPLHTPRFLPYTDLSDLQDELTTYKSALIARHPIMRAQLDDFLDEHMNPVEMNWFAATTEPSGTSLQWRTARERGNVGFAVERALGSPDAFEVIVDHIADPGLAGAAFSDTVRSYAWVDDDLPAETAAWYRLCHLDSAGSTVVHPWLESVGQSSGPAVVINEFMADNETTLADGSGEFDDWLELYNPGPDPVHLGDLYLTDDLADPLQWQLPDIDLAPRAFMLIWCDDDAEQGSDHATFKLAAGGEELGLTTVVDQELVMVDQVVFGAQTADISQARHPDGGPIWAFSNTPTPGAPNNLQTSVPTTESILRLRHVTPNPGGGSADISISLAQEIMVKTAVFDLRGRRVRQLPGKRLPAGDHRLTWDRRDAAGQPVAAGVYVLRLRAGPAVTTTKIAVIR